MSNLRFALATIGIFAAAFVGVSWASKGFPVMTVRAVPMQPDARLPTFEQSVQQGSRKDWENSKTSQGDNDPGRNQMRRTTIQAANAYALSPCDSAIKAAFVVAASTYMRATVKSEKDAKNFSTSMDQRVRDAIEAAFDAGGVTTKDFPKGTPLWARAFMNEQMDNSLCGADKQAERRTR